MKEMEQIVDRVGYLYDRWQDEREYEDFAEYKKFARKEVEKHGATYKELRKSPFRLWFKKDKKEYRLTFKGTEVKMEESTYE